MWRHNALVFHDASPDTQMILSPIMQPVIKFRHWSSIISNSPTNLDTSSTELKYHFTPKKYSYKTVPRSLFPLFPVPRSKIDPRSHRPQVPKFQELESVESIESGIRNEERIITFSKPQ